jgi:hypothetical protein
MSAIKHATDSIMMSMSVSHGQNFITNWYVFLMRAASPEQDALAAILFSAISAEAFINELADAAAIDGSLPAQVYLSAEMLRDLGEVITLVERGNGSTILKYQLAKKILSGSSFERGSAPFQDFANLMALRNALAHPGAFDKFTEEGRMQPVPSVIRDLQQRGLTRTRGRKAGDAPGGASWLYEITCTSVAKWAYDSAHSMIRAILELLPSEQVGHVYGGFRSRLEEM